MGCELGEEFIQIHLWEAFRFAGVLHNRALLGNDQNTSTPAASPMRSEIVSMEIFASVQAIVDSGAFTFRQPLARAIFYPLFIAGLFAENYQQRRLTRLAFQHLMEDSQERTDGSTEKVALDIVTNVWEMGKGQGLTAKLALATEFAAELNVELHLY
jgi:hypothetical protein